MRSISPSCARGASCSAFFSLLAVGVLWPTRAAAEPTTSIEVVPSGIPGVTCVAVGHPCVEPEGSKLFVDGKLVIKTGTGVAMPTPGSGAGVIAAPCIDESLLGAGEHTISVLTACDGETTRNRVKAMFEDPGLELLQVDHPRKFEWSAGETVEILVHARQAGLTMAADFGEVDSEYFPGMETVEHLGSPVSEHRLRSGDTFRLGTTEFVFGRVRGDVVDEESMKRALKIVVFRSSRVMHRTTLTSEALETMRESAVKARQEAETVAADEPVGASSETEA